MQITKQKRPAIGAQGPIAVLDAAGESVAVWRAGAGRPVLCLSATGHGGRDFEPFADRVTPRGFEVVTVDWPGHGNSPDARPGSPVSASHYARIVADLVPQLWPGGERPILLGNSIGGAAGIQAAAAHPDRFAALVVSNAGGLAPLDGLARFVIAGMVAFFIAGARGAGWFPRAFGLYYRLILQLAPARPQRARIAAASPELAPLLARAWESFRQPDADIRALVPRLRLPVLWAWAKHDRVVAWSRSKAAVLTAPDHQVRLFPGGHSPFLEAPDEFAEVFLRFAALIEGRSG